MRKVISTVSIFLSLSAVLAAGPELALAGTKVIGSAEFRLASPTFQNGQFNQLQGFWLVMPNLGQVVLAAPVELPDGATLTGFTAYYYDDDAGVGIECNLRRNTIIGDGGFNNVLAATASTEDDTSDHSMTAPFLDFTVIDNSNYYYFIQADFAAGTEGVRRLYAAVIEYDDPVSTAAAPISSGSGRAAAKPNPFAASTEIQFTLTTAGPVTLDIFDVRGRRVRTIEEPRMGIGTHALQWDGRDDAGEKTASGVYFAQVRGSDEALAAKLVRVR